VRTSNKRLPGNHPGQSRRMSVRNRPGTR
jgi:hypothetical protein